MADTTPIRVAVVGATGYAGAEVVRLLARHPAVQLTAVTSERDSGRRLTEVHPYLGDLGLTLEAASVDAIADKADFAFVALPHGTSTQFVEGLISRGLRVVDLGADFRFDDVSVYSEWYGEHGAPALLGEAVYGLTEHARDAVTGARLVANPGCYPTGALMGLLPLASAIDGPVVVDSKSGTSGAGRAASTAQLFAEVTENVRPYKIASHRHQPEISEKLSARATSRVPVVFSPHLLPVARGLLSTCYVRLDGGIDVGGALADAYAAEPFVRLLEPGAFPEPRNVRGTNMVEIGWTADPSTGLTVVLTAIDNLGKGAGGQAVQNMNRMLGLPETTALEALPALP